MDKSEKIKLYAEDGIKIDNKVYFVCSDIPVLYSIELDTNEIEICAALFNEQITLKEASRKIVKWNDELVIVPYNSKYIYYYNLISKEMRCIEESVFPECGRMYMEAFAYSDKVIMIGAFKRDFLELNMITKSITIHDLMIDTSKYNQDLFCRSGYVICDDCVYVALAMGNSIIKLDLRTWDCSVIQFSGSPHGFSGIDYDGKYFWLTDRRGNGIYYWDGFNELNPIKIPFEIKGDVCNYGGLHYDGKNVWVYGLEGEYSAVIDAEEKCILKSFRRNCIYLRKTDDCLVAQDWDGVVHVIGSDGDREYITEIAPEVLLPFKKSLFNLLNEKSNFFVENKYFNNWDYINLLKLQ